MRYCHRSFRPAARVLRDLLCRAFRWSYAVGHAADTPAAVPGTKRMTRTADRENGNETQPVDQLKKFTSSRRTGHFQSISNSSRRCTNHPSLIYGRSPQNDSISLLDEVLC